MSERRPALLASALRFAVAVGICVGVALLARLPLGEPEEASAIRLAWRTARGRIEICRAPTDAEIGQLPRHMRPPETCTETALDYRLRVSVDGAPRLDRVLEPGGLRRTRPLTVEATLPVPSGAHRLTVTFEPWPPEDLDERSADVLADLPRYELDSEVVVAPGRILLLTLDERERLALRGG